MTETLPAWFWMPLAAGLWGYLIVDAILRRLTHRKETLMDTIVIASTKDEGRKRFPSAVAIVTPRSPEAARGITAHRIVVLRSMDGHPDVQDLIEAARPSIATAPAALGGVIVENPETPAEPVTVP